MGTQLVLPPPCGQRETGEGLEGFLAHCPLSLLTRLKVPVGVLGSPCGAQMAVKPVATLVSKPFFS